MWEEHDLYDGVVRYEDLAATASNVIAKISRAIGFPLEVRNEWYPGDVPGSMMYPRYRHYLLRSGIISRERVGVWKDSDRRLSASVHELAREMGY